MNYRTTLFWGGVMLLDYFLLMGLPAQQSMIVKQTRMEPSHCWESELSGSNLSIEPRGDSTTSECRRTHSAALPVMNPLQESPVLEQTGAPVSETRAKVGTVNQTLI